MLNQKNDSVNPVNPVNESLNLAGTPERVAFIVRKTLGKIQTLLDASKIYDKQNTIDAVNVMRVAFSQNNNDARCAEAEKAINHCLLCLESLHEMKGTQERLSRENHLFNLRYRIRNIFTTEATTEATAEATAEATIEPTAEARSTESEIYLKREKGAALAKYDAVLTSVLARQSNVNKARDIASRVFRHFDDAKKDLNLNEKTLEYIDKARRNLFNAKKIDAARSALRSITGSIRSELVTIDRDLRSIASQQVQTLVNAAFEIDGTCNQTYHSWIVLGTDSREFLERKIEPTSLDVSLNKSVAIAINVGIVVALLSGDKWTTSSGARGIVESVKTSIYGLKIGALYEHDFNLTEKTEEARQNALHSSDVYRKNPNNNTLISALHYFVLYLGYAARAGLNIETTAREYVPSLLEYYETEVLKKGKIDKNVEFLINLDPINGARLENIKKELTSDGTPAPVATVEPQKETEAPAPVATVEPKQEPKTEAPAPVVVVAADDRDDVMKEYLTKYDFKKADAVPNMLLDSINKGCPLWSFQWFGFAELPRRYFNGVCFSVNNMILLAFHGGYYVSLTEARRILGDKATPKEGAIARAVLRPVFRGAKNLRKSDLDALRNCEEIDDDTRQRHPDFYMVERVYDQTAFDGLELKKEKELPQNENERNAQAENIFRAFCKANNIGFLETEGNGQAVTQIRTNGLGKVESITINMPSISQFKSATAYYSVLFHEATHAANAVNGCQLTKKREELSAEIGSCIVLNTLGFDPAEYIDDSAHYVQRFKDCANEKNAIKKAWKYAQASALLILDSFINESETEAPAPIEKQETAPAPVATVEPKTEASAPVEPDDDDNARKEAVKELLETLDSFNAAIAYAATTGGIVHMQKAEEIKKEVASLIERADNLNALDSKTLAYFETLCKNIAIVAIKNNLTRLVDDTSRNWDQYQRAALQTLREIETSETVQKNEKLQWRFTDAFNSVVESKTSDDVKTILKNLVNAI